MGRWLMLVEEREREERETESRDCIVSPNKNDQTTKAAAPPLQQSAEPPRPSQGASLPCHVCGSTDFWARPPHDGGGLVCGRCHPHPLRLLAAWEGRSETAAPTISLAGERGRLFAWAMEHSCPDLKFRPWASVVGTLQGWLTFLQSAADGDIGLALEAGESEAR